MPRSPDCPAKEGDKEHLLFCDPPELEIGETFNQYRDIEAALMIDHKNILAIRVEPIQTSNFQADASDF